MSSKDFKSFGNYFILARASLTTREETRGGMNSIPDVFSASRSNRNSKMARSRDTDSNREMYDFWWRNKRSRHERSFVSSTSMATMTSCENPLHDLLRDYFVGFVDYNGK